MAKDTETRVAGGTLLPEDFEGGGLADDFTGTVRSATFLPYDYNGKRDEYSFASLWLIEPDEEIEGVLTKDGMVEVFYSAGDLKAFVPSPDGKEPAGDLEVYAQLAAGEVALDEDEIDDYSGPCFAPIGKRQSISPSCRLARAIGDAIKAGFPGERIIDLGGRNISAFVGARGHFNRLPDQERSGIRGGPAQKGGSNDILVMTEFMGFEEGGSAKSKSKKATKTTKAASKSKASKAKAAEIEEEEETEEEESDLVERAQEAALTILADAEDTTLPSAKLAVAVAKEFDKAEKGAVMKLVRSEEFKENGPWTYDEEEDTLSL